MDRLPDIPLLTADRERALAEAIEAGVIAAAVRAGRVAPPACDPTAAELAALIDGGRRAEHAFLGANLRLVKMVSVRMALRGAIAEEDLFQEGYLGLTEALWRFDHRRGVRFATYALPWIRSRVIEAVRHRHPIRVPVARVTSRPRMVPLEEWQHTIPGPSGADPGRGTDGWPAHSSRVPWPTVAAELPSRHWSVIRWRFGLDGPRCTHDEIARRLGCSHATARRLEQRALAELRAALLRHGVESLSAV